MDDWEAKYRFMRDEFMRVYKVNSCLEAENEGLALALRTAQEDWLTAGEQWEKAAYSALAPWRSRN